MLISDNIELSIVKNNEKSDFSDNNYDNIMSYTYQVCLKENELLERITEIENLEEDWDGYGACEVDKNSIKVSKVLIGCLPLNLLNKLSKNDIYPNSHGTITLEWFSLKDDKFTISLEIGDKSSSYYVLYPNEETASKEYFDLKNTSEIQNFISILKKFYQIK